MPGRAVRSLSLATRAAALCAALAASACLPRRPPPELSAEPRALLGEVRRAQGAVRRVRGEARARMEAPGGSGSARQFIAAERPDRLHLEVLDFFGNPAAVLVTEGGRFALYDARKKVLYRGAATPENLARLFPLPLPAEDLVDLLCGAAPLLDGAPVRVDPGPGYATLRLEGSGEVQELRVGARAAVERSSRQVAGGAGPGSYELELGARSERGGAWFPGTLHLRSDPAHVRLDLTWTEVEVNGELDPGLFRLEPPRGARVMEVGADGS